MESKAGNSNGVQIPKKSRSLDLKSLYKSKISKDKAKVDQGKPVKRKSSSQYSADEESRKKRNKKQVSRITSEPVNRNSKKSVAAVVIGCPDSGSYGAEDIKNGAASKSNTGGSENGSSFCLDGNAIQIPKRKRGFVRRRKVEGSQEMKLPEHPSSIPDCDSQPAKLEECVRDDFGNGNHDGCSQDIKENAISSVAPDKHPKMEAIPAQNDGLSLIKPRRKHRKSKNVEVTRTEFVQVAESAINSTLKTYIDMQEDDEENLEENAARMLSSRFDPSCTGTCSKGKSSAKSSKCKTTVKPHRNSRYRSTSPAISDTLSLDAADRILRPRKENKEKGVSRKRRHFYEISAEELDALWVLNKRIKVFWPLDEKWYFGLVNEYDEERKLHHIKYDDRDEEWINLQNERFKLLLLRGEVTGKAGQKRVVSMEKHLHYRKGDTRNRKEDRKRNLSLAEDSAVMDSEPIISWLARSLSSTSHSVKKQKSSLKVLHSMPSACYNDTTNLQVDSLIRLEEKLHCEPASVDKSACSTENAPTKQRTLPIVYVRRNSRRTGESLPRETEDDSVYASVLKSEHDISPVAEGASGYDVSREKSQNSWPLWFRDESSFLDQITTALTGSGLCKLKLCVSVSSILNCSLTAGNFQLFHALLLLQYGVVMIMWPKVHLEILFIDRVVGLRFLLFEGSLKDALAFTFMVLTIFTPSSDEVKNVNLQSTATSTSFKFVSVQGSRKQLVFGFDNFIALGNSKWTYLDMKLMNQCLLTKRLPLSECTYDNMKAFHGGARSLESCQYGALRKGSMKKPNLGLKQGKSSVSTGYFSHGHCNAKTEPLRNSFVNGPKKPRTQVSYSMPSGGYDSKSRGSLQKAVPNKRIRRTNVKKSADISGGSRRNFELLCCDANVLITHGDRGWRECGAKVLLELADQNEWKLAVRTSGNSRYSYKVHQFLQPGSTNRYTHAMMWKGGKDWSLEFPDRSQWAVFKELYEECHNRNIRAASLKTIPIPGVRLVDDNDDSGPEATFVRGTSKYFRQLETDIEMALNPSRILYDMDSEDEKWIHANQSSLDVGNNIFKELSDELFERTIDRLEKAAYAQNRDQFMAEEIQEFMDIGESSFELIKAIHGYWRQKREKKGVPLIRHFQSPQWERYKRQVREWEVAVNNNKGKNGVTEGCQKSIVREKPTIFAFCMKPRGLEVPNKGSKQRSHKKMSIAVHNSCVLGDNDGSHAAYVRRSNGFGDERGGGHYYESMEEVSPLSQSSSRLYSPSRRYLYQDMTSDRYYYPRTHRNNRVFGTLESSSPRSSSSRLRYDTTSIYSSRRASMTRRNVSGEAHYYPDWQSRQGRRRRDDFEEEQQLENGEMDEEEYIVRDASGAAQHARKVAKLKKERAHRLFFRANMAIHKAVAALMTAEAMKPSSCSTPSSSSPSSLVSAASSSSYSSSSDEEEDNVSGGDQ